MTTNPPTTGTGPGAAGAPATAGLAGRREPAGSENGRVDRDDRVDPYWLERSRLVLTPVAAPSILGLFGFAGATFMVASHLAGWWGTSASVLILAPFCAMFGGLAQFLAGMWSYKARDGLATAMHGTWGAFWLAFGLFALMDKAAIFTPGAMLSRAFGFWFIVLAVVTIFGALAATAENLGIFTVLALLAAGSALLAAGYVGPIGWCVTAGGWALVASAAAAFYTAGAMMLAESFSGRVILPLGRWSKKANVPGHIATYPVEYPQGMPGSKVGQ